MAVRLYTISGDKDSIYVSDRFGQIIATCPNLDDAEHVASALNARVCAECRGTGRAAGPDVKVESPVAPGLMIWQPPTCPRCDGQGEVAA